MRGLRWALLKSELKSLIVPSARRREAQYADAARLDNERGLVIARDLVTRQRMALNAAWDTLGFRFKEDMIFSIELQFLWGVFYEVVANGPTFPTNGYDRILLHIISYLTREHDKTLEQARDHALGVQALFNEADSLFDAIEQRGRLAYKNGGDRHFIDIVLALHQSGATKEDAYLRIPPAI
jgi:hypothetical protein